MKTGINATKLAIAAFIVPYIFAYSPSMLLENLSGAIEVVQIAATSIIGIFGVAACLNGYLFKHMPAVFRIVILVGGLLLMVPSTITDLVGVVLVAAIVVMQFLMSKKAQA